MTDFSLLQSLQESINDKGRFKAIFVCGGPGAGKSYTISVVQDGAISPRIVNSDKMYEFLGKTGRVDVTDTNAWFAVADTITHTTQAQLSLYVNSMLPLFVDSTSADAGNLLRRKGILESMGYDVGLIWIHTELDVALARAAQRERAVPEDFIRKVYDDAQDTKSFLMARFDWKLEISNSEGELTDAVITKAYNATRSFFASDVKNPIGKRNLREISAASQKYLAPAIYSMSELSHLTSAWFKK